MSKLSKIEQVLKLVRDASERDYVGCDYGYNDDPCDTAISEIVATSNLMRDDEDLKEFLIDILQEKI